MSPSGQPEPLTPIGQRYTAGVRTSGHQPLLTFYDDAGGERTELSYATFDNWASKAANLLVEELDAEIGARLSLGVVDHWTGAVIAAAAWKAGLAVVAGGDASADVVVAAEDDAGRFAGHDGLLVVGPGMGGRVTGVVDGVAFGDEVLAFADDYDDPDVTADVAALEAGGRTWSQAELLGAAVDLIDTGELDTGSRVLTTGALDSAGAVLSVLLAPLVAGASAVWCPRLDTAAVQARASEERATHLSGAGGLTRLG